MEDRTTHVNKPQLNSLLIGATDECNILGRGTGKSEWLDSPKIYNNCRQMPQSGGIMMGASYLQILDRTLPPILKTWRSWGLKDDVDFWVRKFPPKNLKLELPYWSPETAEHAIFIRIGKKLCVMHLIGQDRKGTSNSKSVDWIVCPEAKFLDFEQFEEETLQTNRGNMKYFKDCSLHHGIFMSTDMPSDPMILKRLLKFEEAFLMPKNQERIQLILATQIEIQAQLKRKNPNLGAISRHYKNLNELRKGTTLFQEASTLYNTEVLGTNYVKKLKRLLPDFIYRLSVLNIRPNQVANGFYPYLSNRHFTSSVNYSYIDTFDIGNIPDDCRKDADLIGDKPLILSPDYGGKINVLVVGQTQGYKVRYLKEFYVLHPEIIPHLVLEFWKYYKYRKNKDIVIVYDHTAIAKNPQSTKPSIDIWVDELNRLGFNVTRVYLGATSDPYQRYVLWSYGLKGNNPNVLEPSFNADNCNYLKVSMQQCEIKEDSKGLRKEKKNEKKTQEEYDQREAPHFSDAADNLYWYVNQEWRKSNNFDSDIVM